MTHALVKIRLATRKINVGDLPSGNQVHSNTLPEGVLRIYKRHVRFSDSTAMNPDFVYECWLDKPEGKQFLGIKLQLEAAKMQFDTVYQKTQIKRNNP